MCFTWGHLCIRQEQSVYTTRSNTSNHQACNFQQQVFPWVLKDFNTITSNSCNKWNRSTQVYYQLTIFARSKTQVSAGTGNEIFYLIELEYLNAQTGDSDISKHPPVDDAMPERLPQARLTMTVESSGLNYKETDN